MDGTGLPDSDKLRIIGLLSSYTLSEARMAADAMRAAKAAMAAAASGGGRRPRRTRMLGGAGSPGPPDSYEALLRELVDEQTYPRLYRLAWEPAPDEPLSEREEFLCGRGHHPRRRSGAHRPGRLSV